MFFSTDYTKYIRELQDILTEGQELILHLSRGYKTAARVDHEWREKMKKVIREVGLESGATTFTLCTGFFDAILLRAFCRSID